MTSYPAAAQSGARSARATFSSKTHSTPQCQQQQKDRTTYQHIYKKPDIDINHSTKAPRPAELLRVHIRQESIMLAFQRFPDDDEGENNRVSPRR